MEATVWEIIGIGIGVSLVMFLTLLAIIKHELDNEKKRK